MPIPSQLGQLLGDPSIIGTREKIETDEESKPKPSFNEALEALNLPKQEKVEKGKASKKKTFSFLPHHMLTKIDLSGFPFVSRSSIKELLEAVEMMPCMRALSLRNNKITDDYETEILSIFNIKSIVNIDLSQNLIKKLGADIGKKMRDECSHIQWIDLTQNDFDRDPPTITLILNGLKKQKELIYVGLSA